MQYYRCKCGKRTAWGSMGPASCASCPECKSDLSTHPDCHAEPAPHDYQTKYDTNTGVPYERCRLCMCTRSEIEKGGAS